MNIQQEHLDHVYEKENCKWKTSYSAKDFRSKRDKQMLMIFSDRGTEI